MGESTGGVGREGWVGGGAGMGKGAITSITKLLVGREDAVLLSGFSVQLLMSAPVCLLISLTLVPEGPAPSKTL